ncbi:hypothetical protein HGRIS_006658 [Hohenbuehelia grisea]|uniref:Heterokaryon incompatibility domain-containing protein n=1 Tax=Hohenbuehelia grisea TaxID=104357 RepID=A0ABR3J9L6_9AGAR
MKHEYKRRVDVSVKSGCKWCGYISDRVGGRDQLGSALVKVSLEISHDDKPSESIQKVTVRCSTDRRASYSTNFFYTEHYDPAATFITARPPILAVDSPRAQEEALQCVLHCERHHEYCPRPAAEPLLPDRIIDCQDPANPRLVSNDTAMCSRYLALSYVWGGPQPHSTNEHNVEAYHEKIDPTSLPRTIRDAITLTHAYNIRYLWVDSLCIIQDSASDKTKQLPQMVRIYSDAYFTIIAASARNANEGFLQPRLPVEDDKPDPFFPIWSPSHQRLGTFSLGGIGIYTVGDPAQHAPILSPDQDPVHSRGWCLQEWFLSPRAVAYTSRTLQYHCRTQTQNVGNSRYESLRFVNAVGRSNFYQLLQMDLRAEDVFVHGLLDGSRSKEYVSGVLRAWRDILVEYTRRSVTQGPDKLVAFAGVAERFHALRKSRYFAGIWEDTLLLDLLWSTRPNRELHAMEYQAPSWSWAAVNTAITLYETPWPSKTSRSARVEHEIDLADEAMPFGRVVSGRLLVHAPIVRVICRKLWDVERRGDDWDDLGDRGGEDGEHESALPAFRPSAEEMFDGFVCAAPDELGDGFSHGHDADTAHVYARIGLARFDQSDYSRLSDLWAIPLMWNTDTNAPSPGQKHPPGPPPNTDDLDLLPDFARKMWAQGLVLARLRNTSTPGETLYRRVGRWFMDFDPDEEDRYLEIAPPSWIDKAPVAAVVVV